MSSRQDTSPTRAKVDQAPTVSPPARPDHGENTASVLTEAPLKKRGKLEAHDFPDGGGSGGAEAFSRRRIAKKRPRA